MAVTDPALERDAAEALSAAEWRHKEIELAAHELLQYLDRKSASQRGGAA
jgi:hypothetical protein